MHLNLLVTAAPSPFFAGMWRDPDDGSALGYRSLAYWRDVALAAEAAGFDSLIFEPTSTIPRLDPMMVMPALAAATNHIGLVTATGADGRVDAVAHQMASLDLLSDGRIGWRIDQENEDDVRAAIARWERSWSDGAMIYDTRSNTLVAPDAVITPERAAGAHPVEPSRQRTPCLYGHASSPVASRFAEVLMVDPVTPTDASAAADLVLDAVDAADRSFDEVRMVMTAGIVVGADRSEAARLRRHFDRYAGEGTSARLTFGGTAAEIVEQMTPFLDAGFAGFSLQTAPLPGGVQRLQHLLAPALRDAGLLRKSFGESTLREHWFGFGAHHLAADHPAR